MPELVKELRIGPGGLAAGMPEPGKPLEPKGNGQVAIGLWGQAAVGGG